MLLFYCEFKRGKKEAKVQCEFYQTINHAIIIIVAIIVFKSCNDELAIYKVDPSVLKLMLLCY